MTSEKRVGATIERSSVKAMIKRMRKVFGDPDAYSQEECAGANEALDKVQEYLMGRFDRISKKKGGM